MIGFGAKETRTLDLRDANAALCQLSYRPARDYTQAVIDHQLAPDGSAPAYAAGGGSPRLSRSPSLKASLGRGPKRAAQIESPSDHETGALSSDLAPGGRARSSPLDCGSLASDYTHGSSN